ncbi:MAG: hypothetical protein C3F18_03130 [Nitrosomonadales bacterium]|nr:MAG: hypothetical protein C3F18_03130 [Nitrosomonadales bacterium]
MAGQDRQDSGGGRVRTREVMPLRNFIKRINLKKTLLWAGGGFIAYVVLGFLALPPLVKYFAAKALGEKFHRTVAIQEVGINPLNLSLRVKGFSMLEQGSSAPFFAIDELYANLESASLYSGAPVLHAIQVRSPYLRIVRREDASYNVDDILAELLKPSEDPPAKYSLNNIQLQGGKVEFDDRPNKVQHAVSDIRLSIPFLSNLAYQADIYVLPDFSARINGSTLHLTGKMKPFSRNRESAVALELANLDVARYFEYIPLPQKIDVPSAFLDAKLSIAFAQPPEQPPAIALSGTAALRDAVVTLGREQPLARFSLLAVELLSADLLHRKVRLKSLSLKQPELHLALNEGHEVAASAGEIRLNGGELDYAGAAPAWQQPAFDVTALRLQRANEKEPFADIAALALKDIALDLGKRSVTLGEMASPGGRFVLKRGKDGALDVAETFSAGPGKAAASAAPQTPFQFEVRKLSLAGYGVQFTDASRDDPVELNAENIGIDAENLSSQKDRQGKLTLALNLNKTGAISAAGELGINPLATSLALDLKGIKLKPFQPYFTGQLNIIITDGAVSAKGELKLADEGKEALKASFTGDASLDRLATIDKLDEEDFLKWDRLNFRRINVATLPLKVNIAEVALADFYSLLVIHPDGSLNLQQIVKEQKPQTAEKAPAASAAETPAKPAVAAADKPRITISRLTLKNGQVDFSDHFIQPNYSAHLTGLGGEVRGLSSDASTLAKVALKGRVDNQGRLDITGTVNPLSGNLALDLLANLNDFELSSLTPYSSKYAGYGIQKGKLSFDVKYRVENRKLTAENHLFLNQLTFGGKVESPSATKLPVMLAVALLKDRNGNIDISLPIAGSLDDPQFSVGGIIIKVIVNLIVKAVTSPFALIGSLFGGGEELAYLEFDYGRAEIPAGGESKLANIAKALHDRPGLKLDIAGQVDPELDREGLKRVMLERKVKTQKFNELQDKRTDVAAIGQVRIEPEEYAKYLAKAYRQEKIPDKPRNLVGLAKDLPVPEMEKLMLAHFQVGEDDLRDLLNHRALEAKEYLINEGKVEPERVFIVTAQADKSGQEKEADKGKRSRVDFSLGAR